MRLLVEEEGKATSQASRGFKLEFEATPLPFLSVYGGKVTTYTVKLHPKDTPFIGIILYTGETALSFGGSLWAVPFGAMWN